MPNNIKPIPEDRQSIIDSIMQGLREIKNGDVVITTAMDIFNENDVAAEDTKKSATTRSK